MRGRGGKSKTSVAITLCIMFLITNLSSLPIGESSMQLELESPIDQSIMIEPSSSSTHLLFSEPSTPQFNSQHVIIGSNSTDESRGIFSFRNVIINTNIIISANLEIHCKSVQDGSPNIVGKFYPALLNQQAILTESTWLEYSAGNLWDTPGAESLVDRSDWEPPASNPSGNNMTFEKYSINVTHLIQQGFVQQLQEFNLLVATLNGMHECLGSDSALNPPILVLDLIRSQYGNTSSVDGQFFNDGSVILSEDFIVKSETNPTISYSNLTGRDVEFQFSTSPNFYDSNISLWTYSPSRNSFANNSTAGSYTIPPSDELPLNSVIYYRYRSIDQSFFIQNWTQSHFLLPNFNTVDNGDGTATINLTNDLYSFAGLDLIQDGTVAEGVFIPQGLTNNITASSGNEYSMSHFRIFTDFLGLSTNATILDAKLDLTVEDMSNDAPILSLHETIDSEWNETSATWVYAKQGKSWVDGGTEHLSYASDQNIEALPSDLVKSFDISTNLQSVLVKPTVSEINLALIPGLYDASTTSKSKFIKFYSKESQINQPSILITYSWTNNSTVYEPNLIHPIDGKAVWDENGYNLTGDQRPDFYWDNSSNLDYLINFEISNDSLFRNIVYSSKNLTRDVNFKNGYLNITDIEYSLAPGSIYYWRMQSVDGDLRKSEFSYNSFLISSLSSVWLGNDSYRLDVYANAEGNSSLPICYDLSINSAFPDSNTYFFPELIVRSASTNTINGLYHCDLSPYQLPDGVAVVNSQLTMSTTTQTSQNPSVSVYEMYNHEWNKNEATWNNYDLINQWDSPGADGGDRGVLLDTLSNIQAGQSLTWNVTQGVQNSIRNSVPIDFVLEVSSTSTSPQTVGFFNSLNGNENLRPTISLIYTPGSNQLPHPPTLISPADQSWSFISDFNLTTITKPVFEWNDFNTIPMYGFALEIDTLKTFDSSDKISRNSWNDQGFDLLSNTYSLDVDLDTGQIFYWRLRGLTSTYQLGNWSNAVEFYVPDLNVGQIGNDEIEYTLSSGSILPQLGIPNLVDLHITDQNNSLLNTSNNQILEVGKTATGYSSSALLKFTIPPELVLSNVTASKVELSLFSNNAQSVGEDIAVREVLKPWLNNATANTFDGVNNWSNLGGRGLNTDIGHVADVNQHQIGWNKWDITSIVQENLRQNQSTTYLMIYSETTLANSLVYYNSTEANNEQPYLNFTWKRGKANLSYDTPILVAPQNNSIMWDVNSHAIKPELRPTFAWSWANSQVPQPDNYRLIIDTDIGDELSQLWIFDSRVDVNEFNLPSQTFTPSVDIDYSDMIYWSVQPIFSDTLGEIANFSSYVLPNPIGYEINSTDAVLEVSDGLAIFNQNYPSITNDTYFDQGGPTNSYDSQGLSVGYSPIIATNTSSSTAAVSFDLSSLQLPSTYDVMYANITLHTIGGSGTVHVSSSELFTSWDEQSTWSSPNNGNNWINQGALRGTDSGIPSDLVQVNSAGSYSWDITRIVQNSLSNQKESFAILFQPETRFSSTGLVEGNYIFADSEHPNINLRPMLEITYRTVNPWSPSIPTLLSPVDSETLWNASSSLPTGVDAVDFIFNSADNNITSYEICHGEDPRWLNCVSSDSLPSSFTWDPSSNSFTMNTSQTLAKGDKWNYWTVSAIQDYRIGKQSNPFKYRTPNDVGTTDNNGNYTMEFYRQSIFEYTGSMPYFGDTTINQQVQTNDGSDTLLKVGYDSSTTSDNIVLLELNLSEIPLNQLMIVTSAHLELMLASSSISQSSMSISVYGCDSFVENAVTYQNSPTCSTSEITRTSVLQNANGLIKFDITSLVQDSISTQSKLISLKLESNTATYSNISFFSSETSMPPVISLNYIINNNGILPPSQPLLISPFDGSIIYNTSGDIITGEEYLTLTWSQSTGATDYSLFIRNSTDIVQRYDSATSSLISGTTFNNVIPFTQGELYHWWVQPFNQGIPGPLSQIYKFAVGNPNHSNSYDGTYSYLIQDSFEVPELSHVNIQDFGFSNADADKSYGTEEVIVLGEGCHGINQSQCHGIITLDLSQIPLNLSHSFHSVNLTLFVESFDFSSGAYQVDLNLYQLLIPGLNEYIATWNNSLSSGSLVSGLDYAATPLDSVSFNGNGQVITFSFNIPTVALDGLIELIIISDALSNSGSLDGYLTVHSSDSNDLQKRPMFDIKTSMITGLNISSNTEIFNSDDFYEFNLSYFDVFGSTIPKDDVVDLDLTVFASSGSVDIINTSTIIYNPKASGTQEIEVCFGTVCDTYVMIISPGIPVELFASFNQLLEVTSSSIQADEFVEFFAYAVDANGNIVATEIIDITVTNGTFSEDMKFYPYTTGEQSITISWNGASLSKVLAVEVLPGDLQTLEISGCEEEIPAGTSCELYISGFDLYQNLLWADSIQNLQTTVNNGTISAVLINTPHTNPPIENVQFANFNADKVGTWIITVNSGGISDQLEVLVVQGEIVLITMDVEQDTITADEVLLINTTSFDIKGNSAPITVPSENWTSIGDGELVEGQPAQWMPNLQGLRNLTLSYNGVEAFLNVVVTKGTIYQFDVMIDGINKNNQTVTISADNQLDFMLEVFDKNGNQITINADWTVSHSQYNLKDYLDKNRGQSNTFTPSETSSEAFEVIVSYYEQETQINHYTSINLTIISGELFSYFVDGYTIFGASVSENAQNEITADQSITFIPRGYDDNGNLVDNNSITWVLYNTETEESSLLQSSTKFEHFVWEPVDTGNYKILSTVYDLSNQTFQEVEYSFSVISGKVVELLIDSSAKNSIAGEPIFLSIKGIDQDGNIFPLSVTWLEDGRSSENITEDLEVGDYVYMGKLAQSHNLTANFDGLSESISIDVYPTNVTRSISVTLSSEKVPQLEVFTIAVKAFDEFGNEIELPNNVEVDVLGRGDVSYVGDNVWEVETLDEGEFKGSITIGTVTKTFSYTVEGNIAGFFAAGGALYYIAAGLIGLILLAILVFVVWLVRGERGYYDDEDDENLEYDVDKAINDKVESVLDPSLPLPPPPVVKPEKIPVEEVAPKEEETIEEQSVESSNDWMVDYRVESDGTEWGQTNTGVWYYREVNSDEWIEWSN